MNEAFEYLYYHIFINSYSLNGQKFSCGAFKINNHSGEDPGWVTAWTKKVNELNEIKGHEMNDNDERVADRVTKVLYA